MAKEYIERNAALIGVMRDGCMANTVQVLKDIHAADVVEVVRCKDCTMQWGCKAAQYLGNEGFCSYGERRYDNAAD